MSDNNTKSFKISVINTNGKKNAYDYKLAKNEINWWVETFFSIYMQTKWNNFKWTLDDGKKLSEKELNENRIRYLKLVKDFISEIKITDNNYYIDNIKLGEDIKLIGNLNNKYFNFNKDDIVTITSPSFKDINEDYRFEFEKQLCNANTYIENYLWKYEQFNSYHEKKKFIKEIDEILKKETNKFKMANNKEYRDRLIIKPLKTYINLLGNKHIKEELLNLINNVNLSYNECDKINKLVSIILKINSFKYSNTKDDINLYEVNDYLKNEKYLKELYLNSVSKEELFELSTNIDNEDLNKELLLKFYENNYKEITKLFLENNMSTKSNYNDNSL